MRFNRTLFAIITVQFLFSFIVIVGNEGLNVEIGGSIDVHHHVWFTRYTIINGHVPRDQAFEYMPNSLLIPIILSIVSNCNLMPLIILTRNIFSNIVYAIFTFILLSENRKVIKTLDWLLLLLLIAFPSSLGFMPLYLTVNVFPSYVFTLLYVMSKHSKNIINLNWAVLYLVLLMSMLFSNFSYTLITVLLIYTPLLIKTIYSRKNLRTRVFISLFNVIESLYNSLLIVITLTFIGLYLVYVIVDLRTSYFIAMSNFFERLISVLRGGGEVVIMRTRALSIFEATFVGFKVWGPLVIPYSLLVIISLVDLLRNRKQYDPLNSRIKSIDGMSLITLASVAIIGLTPWLGYDTLRLVNVLNLFIPLHYVNVSKKLNRSNKVNINTGRREVTSTVLRLLTMIIITASYLTLFAHALPQGYLAFNPSVATRTFINRDRIELITIVEHFSPPSKFYISIKPITRLFLGDASIVCDRSICHSFMYLDRRDLYLQSKSLSDAIFLIINKYEQIVDISSIEFKDDAGNSIFILICSEPGKLMTEEPIEYRSIMLRAWLMRNSTLLFYNSGITCGFVW